jgi:hypothetical protein
MNKTKSRLLFAILVTASLALSSLACVCNLTDLADEFINDSGSSSSEAGGNVLLEDDFSSSNSGWEVGEFVDGAVGYGNGYYFIRSTDPSMTIWGVAGQNYTDVIIDVDATQDSAGPENNNDYGAACRVQENGDGYYLLISGDGYYSIFKGAGDSFIPLVDWEESGDINQDNAKNHIQASCIGSDLVLIINGKELASASDSTFSSGDIAMTATTYEDQPVEVHFDNVVVTRP